MDELKRLTQPTFKADRFDLFITAWLIILGLMSVGSVVGALFYGDGWSNVVGAVGLFALLYGIKVLFKERRNSRGTRP